MRIFLALVLALGGYYPPISYVPTTQITLTGAGGKGGTVGTPTPTFISSNSGSNTGTTAVGTKVDSTCATDAYCFQLPQPSLNTGTGNLIVVFVTYGNATTSVPTVTDDKGGGSSIYTACGSEAHDTTNTRFADAFYTLNAAAGIQQLTVTFGAAVTHVSAVAQQYYNVNAVDVCAASQSTSAVGTFSSGSVTPTVTGDLLVEYACATNAFQNTGVFTAGSQSNITWRLQSADRRDGCATQSGVYSSTSAINPQMTIGTNAAYVAVGISFKAASQGTAPTGMYISHEQSYSTAIGVTGTFNLQLPSNGNLLADLIQCGGTTPMSITGITDSGSNSWTVTSSNSIGGSGNPLSQTGYAQNATTAGTLTHVVATTGTGDCTFKTYDIVGAATTAFANHTASNGNSAGTGATLAATQNVYPGMSSGLQLGTVGFSANTAIGLTPSGGLWQTATVGAESLSGPYPVDENNGWGTVPVSSDTIANWNWNVTKSTQAVGTWAGETTSFAAPSATIYPAANYVRHVNVSPNTGTQVTSGNLVVDGTNPALIFSIALSSASATVSTGANAPSWSLGSGTAVDVKSIRSTNTYIDMWCIPAPTAGTGTYTVKFSGSVAYQVDVMVWNNVDQTTPCPTGDAQSTSSNNSTLTTTLPTNLTNLDAVAGTGGDTATDVTSVTPNQVFLDDTSAINYENGWANNYGNITAHFGGSAASNALVAIRVQGAH